MVARRLAPEKSELPRQESALACFSVLFPVMVFAAEVPVAPVWGPPLVTAHTQVAAEALLLFVTNVATAGSDNKIEEEKQSKAQKRRKAQYQS